MFLPRGNFEKNFATQKIPLFLIIRLLANFSIKAVITTAFTFLALYRWSTISPTSTVCPSFTLMFSSTASLYGSIASTITL